MWWIGSERKAVAPTGAADRSVRQCSRTAVQPSNSSKGLPVVGWLEITTLVLIICTLSCRANN